jgi:hypothetical protein
MASIVHVNKDDPTVYKTSTQTLTNKTLTAPTINTPLLATPVEQWTYSSGAIASSASLDVSASTAYFYAGVSNAAFSIALTNVENLLTENGKTLTVAVAMNCNNANAFANTLTISQTPTATTTIKWQGGVIPTSSNTSAGSIDVYTFAILRTVANTYTVLAARTRFA